MPTNVRRVCGPCGLLIGLILLLAACTAPEPTPANAPALQQPAPTSALAGSSASEAPPLTTGPTPTMEPSPTAVETPTPVVAPTDAPPPATATSTPTEPPSFDPADVSLRLEAVVDGLASPVYATHAGDGSGRLFVLEKAGVIVVIEEGQQRPQPFLDVRDRVGSSASEQGLLGLAFHPNFAQNGRFFLYYTDRSGATVISRLQADAQGQAGDPASEAVLLTVGQPAGNHNGGMIAFGPDGMLYAGLGDGGAANDRFDNGQNLATLLGTLIRIDVDGAETYVAPAANPFVARSDARPEIWAYGLRNPWRFSFDRATGDLYIADVGQNQWEEINVQPAGSPGGENYGWPIMEGLHCFQRAGCDQGRLVLPIAEYGHNQGCSVTGGYVYRGQAQPSLQGAYLYGDYCSGVIWGLGRDADGRWLNGELLRSGLQISSFGESEEGEVLVVDMRGGLYRLVDELSQE